MPFLVDSVTMELNRHELSHPPHRPPAAAGPPRRGRPSRGPRRRRRPGARGVLDPHRDRPAERPVRCSQELENDLQRVLNDVRAAVEDEAKMRVPRPCIATELADKRPPLPSAETDDGIELLDWLADEHFTFLGYREYGLEAGDEGERLRAVPGTGLGILRSDQAESSSFAALPPEVRAKAREPKPAGPHQGQLPRHRAPPGLPRLRRREEVRRQRRGRSASAASSACSPTPPTARASSASRCSAASSRRSWSAPGWRRQLRRQGPHRDPGDLPARRPVPDLGRGAVPDRDERAAAARAQAAAAVRPHGRLRPLHVVPGLPAARPLHHPDPAADPGDPAHGVRAAPPSTTARWSATRPSRACTWSSAASAGNPLPDDVDLAELEARLVAATRSWADDLADVDRRAVRRGGRAGALTRRYANAFPEGYKADFPARTAVRGPQAPGVAEPSRARSRSTCTSRTARTPGERRLKVYRLGPPISLSHVLPLLQQHGRRGRRRAAVRDRPRERPAGRGSTTSACGTSRRPTWTRPRSRSCSRTPSPPCGAARWRATRSTVSCWRPGWPGGRSWCCARTPATCARPARRSASATSSRCWWATRASRGCWSGCSSRASTRTWRPVQPYARRARGAGLGDRRGDRGRARRGHQPGRGPHPARVPGDDPRHAADELLPADRGRLAQAVPRAEVRPRGDPGPAAAQAAVRDLRLLPAAGGRAPAGSGRWPAAACAGRTAERTSVPRSSAWSRRRR